MRQVETIIVGQGLAGSSFAWQLHWRNHDFLVIDANEQSSSSRVAAGLMTPVTGQRLVPSSRWNQAWPVAQAFYDRIAQEVGCPVFRRLEMLRLFLDQTEEQAYRVRFGEQTPEGLEYPVRESLEHRFHSPSAGFLMREAGQLNVTGFLDLTAKLLQKHNRYLQADIDPQADVICHSTGVEIHRLGIAGQRLVFCRGYHDANNPWLSECRWDSAKGEILDVVIPDLNEDRVVHRGIWIVRQAGELYRVGATYHRETLDPIPTTAARAELQQRLATTIKMPFQIENQSAAVRPILLGRHPLIGLHPLNRRIGCFNGLASKGSLLAPWLAEQLADEVCGMRPVAADLSFQRWL